jgi:SAM-dependent methyltransferase
MRIVNPQVERDLAAHQPLRIDLGSGGGQRSGFYGLDMKAINEHVDIIADLNAPLELLPDNSVSEIYTCHVLEHVNKFVELMEELHRVVRPDGLIDIRVPHFSNPYHYSDPTHVRFFGAFTYYYFTSEENQPSFRKVPAFYSECRFVVESVTITLLNKSLVDRLIFPRLFDFVNKSVARQDFYERRLCRIFPGDGIRYVLRPEKPNRADKARA